MNNITNILNVANAANSSTKNNTKKEGVAFANVLQDSINNLNSLEKQVEQESIDLSNGTLESIEQALLNTQKAELSLSYAVVIRDKIIQAYDSIMKMQF